MTRTLVILAAGRGSRMGRMADVVHKALLPLGGKAAISHIIDNVPADGVIIAVGDRAEDVKAYVTLAHPNLNVRFVGVDIESTPFGPGATLLRAVPYVPANSDVVFASCDTVWIDDPLLWNRVGSWAAVAPRPAGTPRERWCRMYVDDEGVVTDIFDKNAGFDNAGHEYVYTGLCKITQGDLAKFTGAIASRPIAAGSEVRDVWGFDLVDLHAQEIDWVDIGDDAAYTRAVHRLDGYDWSKPTELTYVLPHTGRVVKMWLDTDTAVRRYQRGLDLCQLPGNVVPRITRVMGTPNWLAYGFVPGRNMYDACAKYGLPAIEALIDWYRSFAESGKLPNVDGDEHEARRFYEAKTRARVAMLRDGLREPAAEIFSRVDMDALCAGVRPGVFHGDLAFGNIIMTDDLTFVGIDWRESFGNQTNWGDTRYDIAKMLASCEVHWERARHGNFAPWEMGPAVGAIIRDRLPVTPEIEIIAALSLINSAPLHAPPLDEVLVARGCAWLERALT